MIYDAIIIGAGPAGLMAANQLEQANLNYLLLEKNEKCGKKLLLTGGRRCNVTNHLSVRDFIDTLTFKHKRFLYHALETFGSNQVLSFFNAHDLELVLENNFKYFPKTEKSLSVLEALTKDLSEAHIKYHQSVKEIHKKGSLYRVVTKDEEYFARNVIVSTGSNSFPSTGSSGDGLIFAKYLGINYFEFSPAETHIYSNQIKTEFIALQGVSLSARNVKIKQLKKTYQGDLLFTHFGLSGPVIMHLAEFIDQDIKQSKQSILEFSFIDLSYEKLMEQFIIQNDKQLHKVLEMYTTKRIVEVLLNHLDIESKKIIEIKKKDLNRVCQIFTAFEVVIDRVEDKEKSYVNKGGIDTKELNPKSMEVKSHKGLYFIGEVTDLHGPIGGYNITIALSTGYLSAQDIISKCEKNN
ncbi:MAG: aminoacetone oxidase family FAD-binding enzyme [Acholeplasmataceae bacterium]|nr:aminoacetone oxidase family FAD-binding enzyme [Acholeplasmataceae bacterium]